MNKAENFLLKRLEGRDMPKKIKAQTSCISISRLKSGRNWTCWILGIDEAN